VVVAVAGAAEPEAVAPEVVVAPAAAALQAVVVAGPAVVEQ